MKLAAFIIIHCFVTALPAFTEPPADAVSRWLQEKNVKDFVIITTSIPKGSPLTLVKQYLGTPTYENVMSPWPDYFDSDRGFQLVYSAGSERYFVTGSENKKEYLAAHTTLPYLQCSTDQTILDSWNRQRNAVDFISIMSCIKQDTSFSIIKSLLGQPLERDMSIVGGGREQWIFYRDDTVAFKILNELRGGQWYQMTFIVVNPPSH